MSDEEDNPDFKQTLPGIRPINQDKHTPYSKKSKLKRQTHETQHKTIAYDYDFNLINQDNWLDGKATASFARSGLQQKTVSKLKRGQIAIEARLDLHKLTASEAIHAAEDFLEACRLRDCRSVIIVHGKGNMSQHDKPILKNIVIEYLRENQNVLAYQSAQPRDGGTGALYVLIRAGHKGS